MQPTGTDRDSERPTLLDTAEVAGVLRCSTRHVMRLAEDGVLPGRVMLGRLCRWQRRTIEDWIAGGGAPRRPSVPHGPSTLRPEGVGR